jgi:hypothetical protein
MYIPSLCMPPVPTQAPNRDRENARPPRRNSSPRTSSHQPTAPMSRSFTGCKRCKARRQRYNVHTESLHASCPDASTKPGSRERPPTPLQLHCGYVRGAPAGILRREHHPTNPQHPCRDPSQAARDVGVEIIEGCYIRFL